jgi:thiosulfate/3-mercaptopyruvate sulfurtransferase
VRLALDGAPGTPCFKVGKQGGASVSQLFHCFIRRNRLVVVCAILGAVLCGCTRQTEARPGTGIPSAHLITSEELVKVLRSTDSKPLILNVGPQVLYQQAHIPQAEYMGDGSSEEGIARLRLRVEPLSRSAAIVVYCGCCPWQHCPNVRPAYAELERMGFTNVRVLKIDNDFGTDWVYKDYPIVRPTG